MNLAGHVFTVPEAAELFGVAPSTYYAAVKRGEVPAVRIGRRLVVPGAALARLLEGGEGEVQTGPGNSQAPTEPEGA